MSYRSRIIDALFVILVVSVVWETIPMFLRLHTLAISTNFYVYPAIVGIFYTLYERLRYKEKLPYESLFIKYFLVYLGTLFLLNLYGYVVFPYYAEVLSGPTYAYSQIGSFKGLLGKLSIHLSDEKALVVYLSIRSIKNILLGSLITFGSSYMIFVWYYNRPEDLKKYFMYAVGFSLFLICIYTYLLEFPYFLNFPGFGTYLSKLNPIIHPIKLINDSWPPLFWPTSQARSFFSEPSFLGTYMAFAMPFVWVLLYKAYSLKKLISVGIIINLLIFIVFASQSRTAIGLVLGEYGVFSILTIASCNKVYIKRWLVATLVLGITFVGSIFFVNHITREPSKANNIVKTVTQSNENGKSASKEITINTRPLENVSKVTEQYVQKNITSVVNTKYSRNYSRFRILRGDMELGGKHFITGVGGDLVPAYLEKMIPPKERNNEMSQWFAVKKTQGILGIFIPKINMYTRTFSQYGLIGCFVYFAPLLLVLIGFIKRWWRKPLGSLFGTAIGISFMGALVSGFNGDFSILYTFWVVLGASFIILSRSAEEWDE